MKHPAPPSAAKALRVTELVAPGACAWYILGSSPGDTVHVLLGFLGLAVVVYVAIPVLKTLGVCWSARIEARFMPLQQQRRRRDRTRNHWTM
jgi:hypothetical protein